MKRTGYSHWVKVIVFIMLTISATTFLMGCISAVWLDGRGFYSPKIKNFYNSSYCTVQTSSDLSQLLYGFCDSKFALDQEERVAGEYLLNDFLNSRVNLFFRITDKNGNELLSNYHGQEVGYKSPVEFHTIASIMNSSTMAETPDSIGAQVFVAKSLAQGDLYYDYSRVFQFGVAVRYQLFWILGGSFIVSIVLFVFMIGFSGRKRNEEGVYLTWFDKIPLDLLLGIVFLLSLFVLAYCYHLYDVLYSIYMLLFIFSGMAFVCFLDLIFISSLAARIKYGKFWRNTVVWRFGRLGRRICRRLFHHLPVLWKGGLVLGCLSFVEFCLFLAGITHYGNEWTLLLWMLLRAVVCIVLFFVLIQLTELRKGGEHIAAGDLEYQIGTDQMLWDLKKHGENLNNIKNGLATAVEEKMKSERFKTELITNVSHDIKTPLTSIVNYVDLLSRENIKNEKAAEYIEVLRRQSARLKKLTEDLVEASKASTGNMVVCFEKTNIAELLGQSVCEYEERFLENNLTAILNIPDGDSSILADGRLLWRVFDNLLCNICKYSQNGTRVYIDVTDNHNDVSVSFKNISRYRLNISADELMERFVRGDSSRTTEGSGLGLSIAGSLTELQNGTVGLFIDGDLFKVVVTLPKFYKSE